MCFISVQATLSFLLAFLTFINGISLARLLLLLMTSAAVFSTAFPNLCAIFLLRFVFRWEWQLEWSAVGFLYCISNELQLKSSGEFRRKACAIYNVCDIGICATLGEIVVSIINKNRNFKEIPSFDTIGI